RSGKFAGFASPIHANAQDHAMTSSTSTKIAIVGYGSQGRAHALNLRDSGFDVTVGLRPGGPTEAKAKADGFVVKRPAETVTDGGLVAVLAPAMLHTKLDEVVLRDTRKQGAVRLFGPGRNVRFGVSSPREDLDVVLVAPKGPGALVRREY